MGKLYEVKKARKDYPEAGIKKGDHYYWYGKRAMNGMWGEPIRCKEKPRRSVYSVGSEFKKRMMDLEDDAAEEGADLTDLASQIRELGSEQETKLENVQGEFPNGCPAAEQLQSRIEKCESIADELERAADEINGETTEEEVRNILGSIDWSCD